LQIKLYEYRRVQEKLVDDNLEQKKKLDGERRKAQAAAEKAREMIQVGWQIFREMIQVGWKISGK
jgi:hypothetical protein